MTLPLTPRRGETSAGGDQRPQAVARIPGQASLTPPAGGSPPRPVYLEGRAHLSVEQLG